MTTATVIVKVGTNTLIDERGLVRAAVAREILFAISGVLKRGAQVVLVTSGAVRLGRAAVANQDLACGVAAAIGQPLLFRSYAREAEALELRLAEFLIERSSLVRREEFLNLQRTFQDLFAHGVIPVVNENDALIAGTSWSFGDNDSLAAALAIALKANALIIVSHINGLFDRDPGKDHSARLIAKVSHVNDELLKFASSGASSGGRGGMLSKLKAARLSTAVGIETRIVNGLVAGNLHRALAGEIVGTTFTPHSFAETFTARERWLLAAKNSTGSIVIDGGAVTALRNGKSLLAVGVESAHGEFEAKEIIEVVDRKHEGVAFGIVDYSRNEIETMLAERNTVGKQLIHANNMIVLP